MGEPIDKLATRGVRLWSVSIGIWRLKIFCNRAALRLHNFLVVEAIGEVTEKSKVRNNCDNYDVSIIMNIKHAKIIQHLLNTTLFG